MEGQTTVEINDCRRKEKLITKRVGGDYEIAILDEKGVLQNKYWFMLKDPYVKHFNKIEELMEEIKCQLKRNES